MTPIIDLDQVRALAAGAGISQLQAARILEDMQRFVVDDGQPSTSSADEKQPESITPIRGAVDD